MGGRFLRTNSLKRPVSEAGTINPSNHSMNSLRSDSISYFVAQIAYRNQRLNTDSKDLHSSKDLLVRNVFENSFEENMEHEVRLRACSLGSSKNVFEDLSEKT